MKTSPPGRQRGRRRLRTAGLWSVVVLVAVSLVAGLTAGWSVRRPFPTHDGTLPLAGLEAEVTVHRDGYGIPHVFARTEEDLFRAQGFVHAQDRFWEMDFRRHVTSGRLSELFGPDQLETDMFLRTLGWRQVAEAEWERLSPELRRYLTAYADGVNAWIEQTGGPAATGRKALQYRVLGLQNPGYEVAPWHPVDSLAWLKAMAWDLRGNMQHEIERAALLGHGLDRAQIEQLYPPHPYDQQRPVVAAGAVVDGEFAPEGELAEHGEHDGAGGSHGDQLAVDPAELAQVADPLARWHRIGVELPTLLGTGEHGLGSNAWVLGGEHTDTGLPLLVNDPHLGPGMPGLWYQIGLHCSCDYQVSGFSFSGVPGVVIGHTGQVAWGFTNVNPDVSDLRLERIDGDQYELDGEWRDLTVREETIRVAGGEDRTIRVRQTHRGPLLSDVDEQLHERAVTGHGGLDDAGETRYGVSLAWTALTPGTTAEALFALNRARDFDDLREAAARFEAPAQNLVYADTAGNIGYQMPGTVPVRAGDADGRWISPGWVSDHDWVDTVPFAQLPYLYHSPDGRIVTANQPVIGPPYQPLLTTDWGSGYRSERIHALLDEAVAAGPVTADAMQEMLFDNHQPGAETLVPALLAAPERAPHAGHPRSAAEQEALALLRDWDHQQPADGDPGTAEAHSAAAAAYYNAVWRHLLLLTFDELPEDFAPRGGGRWLTVVTGLLDEPESPWWDRADTDVRETRDDILAQALADAFRELTEAQGADPAAWRWGRMHTLTLRDDSFGTSGIGPVEWLFNRGPVAVAGGSDVVNATAWDARSGGYEVTNVPSMRMIVDLSSLDDSRWIQLTGASGHAFHPHYVDQLEHWRTGEMLPWRWDRAAVEAAATDTLRLLP